MAIPLALVLCTAVFVSPLVASDVRHRADSTLDQLTGLLNRRALEPRFAEVAEQAALTRQPISVVLADIDHFKRANDANDAGGIAETLRAGIEELLPAGLALTCSFGIATASGDDISFERLMEEADSALYKAKRGGRNRVLQHESELILAT